MRALGRWFTRGGEAGEDLACHYLEGQGLTILARNFRCRSGEVDVVAREGPSVVFVEVKDRGHLGHGEGFDAVTFGKRRRVVRAARLWAAAHSLGEEARVRFDVVSIDRSAGEAHIRHDRDAFDADGL